MHIGPEAALPVIALAAPFRAIVIADTAASMLPERIRMLAWALSLAITPPLIAS